MRLDQLPKYKSVMLLQGPVGPFFKRFSKYLKKRGAKVSKVNFNLGDDLFYWHEAFRFKDKIEKLQNYLESLFIENSIEAIFLFGKHREIHVEAIAVAKKIGLDIWVFEEGYIRPGYITLERENSSSRFLVTKISTDESIHEYMNKADKYVFQRMCFWGLLYFTAGIISNFFYPYYKHHKKFGFAQLGSWIKSFIRKILYLPIDKVLIYKLLKTHRKKYFFIPLQVADDFAVINDTSYKSIQDFIEDIIKGFSKIKEKDKLLVFKHHPMDRGYNQYGNFIAKCAEFYGIKNRVLYIHEVKNAKIIKNSCGAVVINSTMGFQILYYGIPLKVMGRAIYDKKGLTYQGSLGSFWKNPQQVDGELFNNFRNSLICECQIQGSFY